jgi:hypothetical protein
MKSIKYFVRSASFTGLCAVGLALFASCASSPQRIDVFILNPTTTQYFVRPISFESPTLSADVDFTVRVSEGQQVQSAVCNFSLTGKSRMPNLPTGLDFLVSGDSTVHSVRSMRLLYADVDHRLVRFTSELGLEDFAAVFGSQPPHVQVILDGAPKALLPTKEGIAQLEVAIAQFTYGRTGIGQ